MSYHPCVSGCGRFLALRTVTITASRVWAFSTLRKLSWMVHVLLQKKKKRKKRKGDMTISELRIYSAVSNMAESLCLCRDSAFVLTPGAALHPVESELIEGHGEGFPRGVPHPSSAPQPVGLPLERAGTSAERGTPPVSFGASPDDQMSIAASEGALSLSGDDDPAALSPSGVVALSEPDPEMMAMLSRAAENVGLV